MYHKMVQKVSKNALIFILAIILSCPYGHWCQPCDEFGYTEGTQFYLFRVRP